MKKVFVLGVILVLLVGIVGCKGPSPTIEKKQEEAKPSLDSKKAPVATSAFEALKAFYLATNEKNYSEAQKYLFSDFLALFEKPPISEVGGIKEILNLFTANGSIEEITLDRENFNYGVTGVPCSPELKEAMEKGSEFWTIYYTIKFKAPLGKERTCATLIKESDTYKITTGWGYEGIATSILNAALAVPWDYTVYNVYSQPSRDEGYIEYRFLVGMKHRGKKLVEFPIGQATLKAVWDQYEYEGYVGQFSWWGYAPVPAGYTFWPGDRGCATIPIPSDTGLYATIEVPTKATNLDFYLITPDYRLNKINTKGPWPEVPQSLPALKNKFRLGQTFEVENDWAVTPLSFKESRLRIRLKNLWGYGQSPLFSFYFLIITPQGFEEVGPPWYEEVDPRFGTIAPLMEKEFDITFSLPFEITEADLLVVIFDKEDIEAKLEPRTVPEVKILPISYSYRIYRLE